MTITESNIHKEVRGVKELTLEASLESLPQVTAWIDEQLEALDCSLRAQTQIDVAIDEIFGNIVHYAYPEGKGNATVRFEHDAEANMVTITFLDHGIPFDPLAKPDPDTTLSAEDREIGGLGIFLVKKTMDDVSYAFRDGMNTLTLKKKI